MSFSSRNVRWGLFASPVLLLVFWKVGIAKVSIAGKSNFTNTFERRDLIANRPDLPGLKGKPFIDADLVNPCGAAIRPASEGGHYWFSNTKSNSVTTYIGDSKIDGSFKPIFQDSLKIVPTDGPPSGQVFSGDDDEFIVKGAACWDDAAKGCSATSPSYVGELKIGSKFIVATKNGNIEAWAEGKMTEGKLLGAFGRMRRYVPVITNTGAKYTGITLTQSPQHNWLLAVNSTSGQIEVYDAKWKRLNSYAQNNHRYTPFAQPQEVSSNYRPFNVWCAGNRVFVTYVHQDESLARQSKSGGAYVAVFDRYGHSSTLLKGQLKLMAPWGIAIAPHTWGSLGGTLLIGDSANGRIVAYDLNTNQQVDYVRDNTGRPVEIEGLWSLFFGNGRALGQSDHLYFTAGPNGEKDGIVGSLSHATT